MCQLEDEESKEYHLNLTDESLANLFGESKKNITIVAILKFMI